MKVIAPLLFSLLFCAAALMAGDKTIYDFTLNSIDGQPAPLAAYKGHVVMLVNVASRCGFTPQYTALESIYEKYKGRGFVIVGIPANNFGSQEPGTNQEIKTFCSSKYSVTFPMMAKVSVKGDDKTPLYQYLTDKGQIRRAAAISSGISLNSWLDRMARSSRDSNQRSRPIRRK
jgi:glutathione peroxidase